LIDPMGFMNGIVTRHWFALLCFMLPLLCYACVYTNWLSD